MESMAGRPDPTPLADVDAARTALAARMAMPPWYGPLAGLLAAQHVLLQGVDGGAWTLPSGLLLVGGCALLWLVWRRCTGVTVWPAAGWRSLLGLGAWSLVVGACVWAAAASRQEPVVVAAAVAVLVASVVLGRVWATALREDVGRLDGWSS